MGNIIIKRVKGMSLTAKIGLVLVFTWLAVIFVYQGWYKPKFSEAAPTANGRIIYSINTTTPQNRTYTASSNTFGAQTAMVAGAAQAFMVDRAAPTRNEHMAGYVTTTGVLYIYKWDGSTWIEVTNTAAPSGWGVGTRPTVGGDGVNGRRFDIAYENTSGNAMVVYSTNALGNSGSAEMAYRVWNGTTWTAAANVVANSAGFNQAAAVTWIKLKARPTSGSNEIALLAADTGTTTVNTSILTSFIWSGSAWTEAATTHTGSAAATLPNTTTQLMQNDCFDQAYESTSGDLLVVFTTASTAQQWYRTYSGGTWGTATSYGSGRAVPLQMIAESDPQSDQILVEFSRSGSTRVYGSVWSGTAAGAVTQLDNTNVIGATPAINKKQIAAKWLVVGGTSYAVFMWDTTTLGTIGYAYFSGGTYGADALYATGTGVAVNWMDSDRDRQGSDTMMLTFSTGAAGSGSLWAKRLVLSAGPTFTWTNADGGTALSTALASATSQNFSFAYNRSRVLVTGLADYPAPGTVQQGQQNVAMLKFQLSGMTGTETWTGGKLDKIGTNANLGDVTFDIYKDTENTGTFTPATDTLIGSGTFSVATGQTYTLTTSQTLTTTAQWYFIIFDIAPLAATGTTVGARIADNTYFTTNASEGVSSITSTSSGTPTILAGTCVRTAPTVTLSPSSATIDLGASKIYSVTIQNNDNMYCSGTSTFTLSVSSETGNTGSFSLPSTLGSTSTGALTYNGTYSTTLTVTSKTSAADGDTLTSTIMARDTTNHSGQDGTGSATTTTRSFLLHNSVVTGSPYWSASGGWGIAGTKYGQIVCATCHEPRGLQNIKGVKTPITSPNAPTDNFPGSTVNFQSFTTSATDMGDDTALHTTSTRICEVCHSQTSYHRYNQATTTAHFNNQDCASACHLHVVGFAGDGACMSTSCHDVAQSKLYNTRQVTGAGGDFVRLSRHVMGSTPANEIVTNYDCVVCHAEGDANKVAAGTGWIDRTMHKNGTTNTGDPLTDRMVKLRNVDNISQTYNFSKNVLTLGVATAQQKEQMRTDLDTFCLNCHDADGASGLDVNGTTGLNIPAASGITPFNSNDAIRNGRDNLTTRTRVIDVKSQFNPGTYKWNATDANMPTGFTGGNYDGYPSQHGVLGPRYSTQNTSWTAATWVAHTTRAGQTMNSATVREVAKIHCSDCHLSERNAHGAANAWHMLLNGVANDYTTDYLMTGSTTIPNATVCYKCHSSSVYANVASTATRFSHNEDSNTWGNPYGGTDAPKLGPLCLNCHAGDGFGNIHGVSGTYNPTAATFPPSGTTYTRYRFLPGAWMQYSPGGSSPGGDNDFTIVNSSPTCYFPSSSSMSNCTHHAGSPGSAGASATNYGRPLKY